MRIDAAQAPAPSTELATISAIQSIIPVEFFKPNGSDAILSALKEEVRKQAAALDISTETGRTAIASLAYKVARSKTALDDQGKSLVETIKKQTGEIDAERRHVRDELDALKEEVRKPLTDWENAEKNRVTAHENALTLIASTAALDRPLNLDEIETKIGEVSAVYRSRNWQEFEQRAAGAHALATSDLNIAAQRAKEAIAQREALERQQAEERERAIKEREESAAKAAKEEAERKAAEQARIAHEAAERERQRVENERIEAEARAKQAEAQRVATEQKAERDRIAAEEAAKEAERQAQMRLEAEKQASERRAKEAAAQAERDREAAIDAERKRVADAQLREAEEAEKRAKNRAHQASVNREALAAFVALGASEEFGKAIIKAIVNGDIPHVRMDY